MITDKDIVFVTTTLHTKWLGYQQQLLEKHFPNSDRVVVDGTNFLRQWPNAWFWWIENIKGRKEKWYIHVDEDFFLENSEEVYSLLEKMESEGYDLAGTSDGFSHFRGNNPVALNSFFMVGKVKDLDLFNVDLEQLRFMMDGNEWKNNLGIQYEQKYSEDFKYPHNKASEQGWNSFDGEPYYLFFWLLKQNNKKFYYLYPFFDPRFKSTNPRILENSPDIGIHLWYTRLWNSPMDVHGMPNVERYLLLENYIQNKQK